MIEITFDMITLIPLFPILGAAFCFAISRNRPYPFAGVVASSMVLMSFIVSFFASLSFAAFSSAGQTGFQFVARCFEWINVPGASFAFDLSFDQLTATMLFVITFVGFLIHVYSTGYMKGDPGYNRYFAYLNLFVFFMIMLVMAKNLPLMFVGWEGVGLCSYLLISFWWDDPEKAAAGRKAFIVNRIGDFAFLIGMFSLYYLYARSGVPAGLDLTRLADFSAFAADRPFAFGLGAIDFICLTLFIGACGKSAQIPLYVWLPDAMVGPTPVSALIHAATMVTAGVYMVVRLNFLYAASPLAMGVVAATGAATAVFAAVIAMAQTDIKKVLAYSTVSQLGFMFLAAGCGAFASAIFHLATHAFFKSLLFLGAGSVIHALGGEQDMRGMGGLAKKIPHTCTTFFVGTYAISGLPLMSGFFSKDEIILYSLFGAHGNAVFYALATFASLLTAIYMHRLLFSVFFGEFRGERGRFEKIHESPASMTVPLYVLAFFSITGGFVGAPGISRLQSALAPLVAKAPSGAAVSHAAEYATMGISVLVAFAGVFAAWRYYGGGADERLARFARTFSGVISLQRKKFFVDEIYGYVFVKPFAAVSDALHRYLDSAVIDRGAVDGAARVLARLQSSFSLMQNGDVARYLAAFIAGLSIFVFYVMFVSR